MEEKKNSWFGNIRNSLCWGGGILAVFVLYVFAALLYGRTIVEWWRPVAIALLSALILWFLLRGCWSRVWTHTGRIWLFAGHMVAAAGVALFLLLGLNYWCLDEATVHSEQVTVESRFRKIHHHTQRAGRRTYRQGSPYYTYHLRVRFANGREKDLEVSLQRYNRTRTGSEMTLDLGTGCLGYPVITGRI